MLNALFALHRPKGIENPYRYYPDVYAQDKSKSIITADNFYDLKRISKHEGSVIRKVLRTVKEKYPEKYGAIGLANESYPIKYKPRYVLFDIVVQLYEESTRPPDLVAVSFAYESKGAIGRQKALEYYEKAKEHINLWELNEFSSISVPSYFMKIANAYEREHRYQEAIDCLKIVKMCRECNTRLCKDKISELKSIDEIKPVRRRKITQRQIEFEADVHAAALYYIREEGMSL